MTKEELIEKLGGIGVERKHYSLDETYIYSSYNLTKTLDEWEVFYLDIDGEKTQYKRFQEVEDAYNYLFHLFEQSHQHRVKYGGNWFGKWYQGENPRLSYNEYPKIKPSKDIDTKEKLRSELEKMGILDKFDLDGLRLKDHYVVDSRYLYQIDSLGSTKIIAFFPTEKEIYGYTYQFARLMIANDREAQQPFIVEGNDFTMLKFD